MPLASIPLKDLQKVGIGLKRPEGVAVGSDGRVWASDEASACAILRKDGTLKRVGLAGGAPNGIAFDCKGRIVIANFGLHAGVPGPLQRLDPMTGALETVCGQVDGRTLSTCNFPVVMKDGSIYCTHSSWAPNFAERLRKGPGEGFIFRVGVDGHARKAAEALHFPKGCCIDAKARALYVVQATAANVLRFEIAPDGALRPGFQYGPTFGVIPDTPPPAEVEQRQRPRLRYGSGCAFDAEGNLWVTLDHANLVIAITTSQQLKVVIDDPEGKILREPTNIAFGGADMCDVYIGSTGADYVVKARSSVPGLPLVHQI